MTDPELCRFLVLWREQLKTYLREDPRNILKTRYRKMADTIPSTFPRLSVLKNC